MNVTVRCNCSWWHSSVGSWWGFHSCRWYVTGTYWLFYVFIFFCAVTVELRSFLFNHCKNLGYIRLGEGTNQSWIAVQSWYFVYVDRSSVGLPIHVVTCILRFMKFDRVGPKLTWDGML